jgi:glyoxylase-like metal-dependent hydrolase (beta-lactamase superfamily II)
VHAYEARGGRGAAVLTELHRVVGVLATNLYVLGDDRTREAIAIDTATPSLEWITGELAARQWTLKLIVSTHRHWDHIGDNARVAEHTGADIAAHPLDAHGLIKPHAGSAPFEIPPSVPAVELQEGGEIRFGSIRLEVLHTPGHTEGSVCLLDRDAGRLYSGDTLFKGSFGRVDLPGGSSEAMVESLDRLRTLDPTLTVLPGHGPVTTIASEQPWLEWVAREGRLPA